MKKEETVIFDTDEGIVEYRTDIEGWVGKDGRYYGKDDLAKNQAIYSNCTHRKCDQGHVYKKFWSNCPKCRELSVPEEYKQLEFKPWDGVTPLALYDSDKYFFDEDDIIDYMYDNDLTKDEIMLVICKPAKLWHVETDFWEEIYPEDWDLEDICPNVAAKLKELNKAIDEARVASWWPSNKRTIYDLGPKDGTPM